MTDDSLRERGMTLIEVMVVTSIGLAIFLAVITIAFQRFNLIGFLFEQGSITTTARTHIDRMADTIRAGTVTNGGVNDISVTGDFGTIRYWLNGTRLMRQVNGGPAQIATRGIRNLEASPPVNLFRYYSIGGPKGLEINPQLPGAGPLARVNITLVVDIDPNQIPREATVETEVTLR